MVQLEQQIAAAEAAAIRRSILSGSPTKILLTWKKQPALRTLATVATRTERNQQQPAPPVRRVASILEQLAKKAESK